MSQRLKLAYLLPPISDSAGWRSHASGFIGGIQDHVEPLLLAAEGDRAAAEELFPRVEKIYLPAIQDFGPSPAGLSEFLATVLRLWSARSEVRVDVVHSLEAYPAGLVGHLLSRLIGKPHIITAHGTYAVRPVGSRIHRAVYKRVLQGAQAICPVSPETGQLISECFPELALSKTLYPVANGNDFYAKVDRQVALERNPAEKPMMLSVGAFKKRKGQDLSLRAFQEVKRRVPSLRYRIIGTADDRKFLRELERYIERERVEDVEILTNATNEELDQSYRSASVFVLTPRKIGSQFEGFGLVYLEAGAYGLPVVGTRSGGVPSAIRSDETGILVPPDDVASTAQAIEKLVVNRGMNRRMGLNNRNWSETLTWERTALEQMSVYRKVLPGSEFAPSPASLGIGDIDGRTVNCG